MYNVILYISRNMSNATGCTLQELLYNILLSWHGLIPSLIQCKYRPPEKKEEKSTPVFWEK